MATQEEWRRIAYERSLGQQGTPVGTITSYKAYEREYLPRVEAERQRDLAIYHHSASHAASAADLSYPQGGRSAESDFGFAAPISSGSSSGTSYAPAGTRPASLALLLMFAAIVLAGAAAGLWAWAMGYPDPVASGLGAAWFVVRLCVTIVGFLLSQLVLLAYEAVVAAWPLVDAAIEHVFVLPPLMAVVVGLVTIALLLMFVGIARRLLRMVPHRLRSLTMLAVLVGALATFVPDWWSKHLALTNGVTAWAKVNIDWLVFI